MSEKDKSLALLAERSRLFKESKARALDEAKRIARESVRAEEIQLHMLAAELVNSGHPKTVIASSAGITRPTLYRWISDIDGLGIVLPSELDVVSEWTVIDASPRSNTLRLIDNSGEVMTLREDSDEWPEGTKELFNKWLAWKNTIELDEEKCGFVDDNFRSCVSESYHKTSFHRFSPRLDGKTGFDLADSGDAALYRDGEQLHLPI